MRPLSICCLASAVAGMQQPMQMQEMCQWGPLQRQLPDLRCEAPGLRPENQGEPPSASPGRSPGAGAGAGSSQKNQSDWSGPHSCVGKYCVWASQSFGGGIMLITSEDNAKRAVKLTPVPHIYTKDENGRAAFAPQIIADKGVGLVANRPIKRGELIMAEAPTALVQKKVLEDRSGKYLHTFDLAVNKLPAPRRRAFMKQMWQGDHEGGARVADILFTNSFQMALAGDGVQNAAGFHYGNFPNVSRLNHDCRPNLVFHIGDDLVHRSHAARDISAGEELTISYGDPLEPVAQRQARLRSFGFKCSCAHCQLSAKEAASSDARISRIQEMERELGDFGSTKASTKMVEELLKLYKVERLESKIAGAYTLAALNYNLFGWEKSARKYATLAAEAVEMEFGVDAGDAKAMRDLARNPRGHFTWKQRR